MNRDRGFRAMGNRLFAALALWSACAALGQTNLPLYTDSLVNGFQDWSWSDLHDFSNTSPTHTGAHSIAVHATAWQAVALENDGFNPYRRGFEAGGWSNLVFWANGGAAGGQRLQVYAVCAGQAAPPVQLPGLAPNTWSEFAVSLQSLGVAGATNLSQFVFQLTASGTTNPFYLDDVELTARPAPALAHITLDATRQVRTADSRWFGLNTAVWDGNFDTPQTISLLRELGVCLLRFPGGSLSDEYHWASDTSLNNSWRWATSFSHFIHVATNIGAQAIITVNYGTGTPAEAADWVRCANITNQLGFKYWEIGNECYGTWETDSNSYPHDAYTYATRAAQYLQEMKAVDPAIHVGVVVSPGEDSHINGYTNHPATNALTGQVHYGWTPVLLSTLRTLGVTPDFLVDHRYPEYTGAGSTAVSDSDPLLLQCSEAWAGDAADLRGQLAAYLGPAGTNVELLCTENNSDAGAQGRQSTSLVNALYYADSLGRLMQTEFNSFVWWDLRNGSDTNGSFDPSLYGWRTVGDLGMVGGLTNRYPPFYAAKLMRFFARPGDSILAAASDCADLTAYAARRADGALALLVLNKNTSTSLNAQVSLAGFVPDSTASLYSYGIPQDQAARSGIGSPDIAQTSAAGFTTNFDFDFPPLSLSLFLLPPEPPHLAAMPVSGSELLLQLEGQPGAPYVIQTSTNLRNWVAVATDAPADGTFILTNAAPAPTRDQFWRAAWQP